MADSDSMVYKKSWDEFRNTGLLWFTNTILHVFGWAIVIDVNDNKVVSAYPARVKFRGFNEDSNSEGYEKVSQYMKDNADELLKESKE
jgi:hypothetical protein